MKKRLFQITKTECVNNDCIDDSLQEYFMLREEIIHHKDRQNMISTFAYTTVAALLGIAVAEKMPYLAMIPLFILLPMALKFFESRYSIALLSTYMKTYLERSDSIQWETNLSRYYEKNKRKWHEKIVYRISKFDFVFLCLASIFTFWIIYVENNMTVSKSIMISIICIQLLLILVLTFFTCKYFDYKKLKESKLENWKKLKNSFNLDE